MEEELRYLIQFVAQITGEENIERLKREIGDLSKLRPTKIKIDYSSGKETRDYLLNLKKEIGEDWQIRVRYVHDPKKGEIYRIVQKELKKEAGLTIPLPTENLNQWASQLKSVGQEFTSMEKVVNASLTNISRVGKDTAKTFKVYWVDKAGKEWVTTVKGVVRGNKLVQTSLQTVSATARSSTMVVNDFVKALRRVMIVVPVWYVFRRVLIGAIETIRESMRFLIDWEQQLARIRIVGKGTEEEIRLLSSTLLKLAKTLGVSTKELGQASVLWAQQGRSVAEIIPLMESTARLSLITGRTMTQSVEDLTAIMKAYKLEAEDTGRVIDSITNVMLNHAVTASVLVEALRNVAPVAKQFNISFEQLLGIITATHAVTRAKGSSLGRAWRTIFARMATSGAEAIQRIAKIPVYLDEQGKASETATYRMRNLGDILTEIALKWNTLTKAQKINLAQALAGKRRLTELMAYLGNYNEALKAHVDALFSVGKANKSVAILTDTLANRLEALSGSWKSFVEAVGDTTLIKGSVSLLSGLFSVLSEAVAPAKASYNRFLDSVKQSNEELNRQIAIANAQMQVWKEARHLAEFFKREPALAKQFEANYVRLFIEAMKQAGIEVNETIKSMQDLANFMEKRIPVVTDAMTEALHGKFLNKMKTGIRTTALQIEKLLIPLQRQLETAYSSLAFTPNAGSEVYRQHEILMSAFEKMRNLQELNQKEIFIILDYFRKTSKTSEEWMAKLKLVRDYMSDIRKLQKKINDDSEARIEAEAKVNSIIKEETTTMITAEQARKRIADIEKQALAIEEERLVTVNKILDFLNKENIAYDDSLERLKERLEKEKIRLTVAKKHEEIRDRLNKIEIAGLEAGKSRLAILKEQLDYLSNFDIKTNATLKKETENLQLQIKRLEAQQKLTLLKERESLILEQMRAYGATDLQLEIQRYEIMKARGEDMINLSKQAYRIQKQMMDEINASADQLGQIFANAFEELFLGTEKVRDVISEMIDSLRKDIATTLGETLKNQIFQATGIGAIYGEFTAGMKNTPYTGVQKGFYVGSQIAYKYILKAHMEGARLFYGLTRQGIPAGTLTTATGMVGFPPAPYMYRTPGTTPATTTPTGFWNRPGMRNIGAFLMGAFAGSGGGWASAISSGMSSMFLAMGHPLLALGALLFGGLFRKKKVITRETPKQIAGQLPLHLGIQVPGLPKLYALPQSFYFNASINVNIDKVQGESPEIADKIASEVAKATQEAFSQSYVRDITRAILPRTMKF